jgi:hypothetical protein
MIREGFDCVLRTGELGDSLLIQRRLATLERGTFARPGYLSRFGAPHTPDCLDGHQMVGLMSPHANEIIPLVFRSADKVRELLLPAVLTVTGPETNVASACLGLGLIQVPSIESRRNWRPAPWSRFCRTFRRRPCLSTSSIPAPVSFRRVYASSSTGRPTEYRGASAG